MAEVSKLHLFVDIYLFWGLFLLIPMESCDLVQQQQEESKEQPAAAEEGKKEESKKEAGGESGSDGGKKEEADEKPPTPPPLSPPPPPQEEVVMRVYMDCAGCARKVRQSLRGFPGIDQSIEEMALLSIENWAFDANLVKLNLYWFGLEGVEEVVTDSRTHLVVVKGRRAAEDPLKVVARVQKKSGKKVELLSPLPTPPTPPEKKEEDQKPIGEDKVEAQDSNRSPSFFFFFFFLFKCYAVSTLCFYISIALQQPQVIVAVLRVYMHCEACAQEIKKRILRMKGLYHYSIQLNFMENRKSSDWYTRIQFFFIHAHNQGINLTRRAIDFELIKLLMVRFFVGDRSPFSGAKPEGV